MFMPNETYRIFLASTHFGSLERFANAIWPKQGLWWVLVYVWRLARKDFVASKGAVNQARLQEVLQTTSPGVILYHGLDPVGWCAVAPRADYPVLARSRVMASVDDKAVWSVSCFFVRKEWRKKGIGVSLLRAAMEFAKGPRGVILEGYPTDSKKQTAVPIIWTGLAFMFKKAGFKEVARRSATRPIFRKNLAD